MNYARMSKLVVSGLAPLVAVLLLFSTLIVQSQDQCASFDPNPHERAGSLGPNAGMTLWVMSTYLYRVICWGAFLPAAVWVLLFAFPRRRSIGIDVIAAWLLVMTAVLISHAAYDPQQARYLQKTLTVVLPPHSPAADFETRTEAYCTGLVASGFPLIGGYLSIVALLAKSGTRSVASNSTQEIRRVLRVLDAVTIVTSWALIPGIIKVFGLFSWAMSAGGSAPKDAEVFVKYATIAAGAVYSLLTAVVYIYVRVVSLGMTRALDVQKSKMTGLAILSPVFAGLVAAVAR